MEILYLLIPLALLLVGLIVAAFWWATHTNQFDDLEGPAYRILMEDSPAQGTERDGSDEHRKVDTNEAGSTSARNP